MLPPVITTMTPKQKKRAQQLTNLFENGTIEFQYDYVEALGDGRGYTCGRVGFTTGTGDALEVIKRYTKQVPSNPLAKYIPELERLNKLPEDSPQRADVSKLAGFPQAWKQACKDKAFLDAQDAVVDNTYFYPAMLRAYQIGIKTALGKAILYDTIIQHGEGDDPDGLPALIAATKKLEGTPKSLAQEIRWLLTFLEVRRKDLQNAHNPDTRDVWRESVGRVDTLKQLIDKNNYDLNGPFAVVWEGDHYIIP